MPGTINHQLEEKESVQNDLQRHLWTFPLPFVELQEIKQIKPAEVRVHERIQITGTSPNDHTDNKTLLETSTPVEINMSESIEPLVQFWGQFSELWREKEAHFVRWLGNWLMLKMERLGTEFSFHSFVCRNQSYWEQVKAVGDEAGAQDRDE